MAEEEPSNPFESPSSEHSNGNGSNGNGNGNGAVPEDVLPQGTSGVAAKGGKTYLTFGLLGLVVAGLLYSIFSGDKKDEVEEPAPNKLSIQDRDKNNPPPLPTPDPPKPPTPEPPPLPSPTTPTLPLPVPPIPDPVAPPAAIQGVIDPKEDSAAQAQALARIHSNMMVKDGGAAAVGGASTTPTNPASRTTPNDPNSQFAAVAAASKAERVDATKISALNRTIAQGRIIQATLESAINTDLPAPIRAIVSVDTYGEAGTTPLIPKGSRLIGTYNTTLTSGQTRVFVVWQRVLRPDGVDVQLGSPLVDPIGQAGVAGQLDTKFQEIFARSLVSSVMNIAMAIGTEKLAGGTTTTTTSTTGTQTSGDTVTTATTNALNRLGSMTDSFIQRFISVPPTILVDQGTKVNVMVNKDLYFPEDTAGVRILN